MEVGSYGTNFLELEEGRLMIHKWRRVELKLELVGEIVPVCKLYSGVKQVEPLKRVTGHEEGYDWYLLIVKKLMEGEEVIHLKQPPKSILSSEHRNLDFW